MAALQKVMKPATIRVLQRNFSDTSALRAIAFDPVNPADIERVGVPESDALAAKEKGPWTALNKEDKIALYRSQFPLSMVESQKSEPEAARITFGITIGVAAAVIFFTYLKTYVGPQAPRTITPEWREAQAEKMKLYRMNPITGLSSK